MSNFSLTQQQIHHFDELGYTALKGGISVSLLQRLRDVAETLEQRASLDYARGNGAALPGCAFAPTSTGYELMRINDIYALAPDVILDILASPSVMALFRQLGGRFAVPLQVDLLFKRQAPHPPVLWHQDAPVPREHPYFNVGIYLDEAAEGDGCVRYVPGSQHVLQDIAPLAKEHGWEIPGVKEASAQPGDILIHDMMVLHGSPVKCHPGVRRTLYVEIRAVDGILESGSHSPEWVALRRRFMGLVLRRADPALWPQAWQDEIPGDLVSDEEELAKIVAQREPPLPANYASEQVTVAGYPV